MSTCARAVNLREDARMVMDICKGVVPNDIIIDDVLVKCHKYTNQSGG